MKTTVTLTAALRAAAALTANSGAVALEAVANELEYLAARQDEQAALDAIATFVITKRQDMQRKADRASAKEPNMSLHQIYEQATKGYDMALALIRF